MGNLRPAIAIRMGALTEEEAKAIETVPHYTHDEEQAYCMLYGEGVFDTIPIEADYTVGDMKMGERFEHKWLMQLSLFPKKKNEETGSMESTFETVDEWVPPPPEDAFTDEEDNEQYTGPKKEVAKEVPKEDATEVPKEDATEEGAKEG